MAQAKYGVDALSIEGLLTVSSTRYEVPAFQRTYSWGAEEIAQFIDDIFGDQPKENLPYFIGAIVVAGSKEEDGINTEIVLDGQQRLTTVSLLIAALIQRMAENGSTEATEQKQYLFSRRLKGNKKVKISLQKRDNKIYEEILAQPTLCFDQKYKGTNIGHGMSKIFGLIDKNAETDKSHAYADMLSRLLYDVELVKITAPSEKEAFRLFETLNDRGLALSAADLIKNKLLSHCGEEIDDAFEAWGAMINVIRDEDIVNYLRHYWISSYGFIRKRGMYDGYKKKIDKFDPTAATLFALELQEQAVNYQQIASPDKNCPWSDDVANSLDRLNSYRARSCRAALLATAKNRPDAMLDMCKLCESITVRYTIVGERNPNLLEVLYGQIAEVVRNTKKGDPIRLSAMLFKDIPDDGDFLSSLGKFNVDNVTNAWREMLITANDQISTGELVVGRRSKVHVEHILPVKPRAMCLAEGGLNEDDAAILVNMLGNLTLLEGRKNKELSNKPFSQKRGHYLKSEIALTKVLGERQKWGKAEIELRTNEISALVAKAYPHPVTFPFVEHAT